MNKQNHYKLSVDRCDKLSPRQMRKYERHKDAHMCIVNGKNVVVLDKHGVFRN